jgi:hypothetical protein
MELFETLKQFKKITPDATRQEISKRAILAQTPLEPRVVWGVRRSLAAIFETGFAVALTVFFILIIIGKFPGQSSVAPVQLSVINPTTLKAEAQAVDIQIQLAQIAYTETTSTAESTPQTTAAIAAKQPGLAAAAVAAATSSSATSGGGAASSTNASSTSISIDQALQELSQ